MCVYKNTKSYGQVIDKHKGVYKTKIIDRHQI